VIVVAELKAKVILLEANAKNNAKVDITQRLSNLPSHPKKEMADARAEIVAKDKKNISIGRFIRGYSEKNQRYLQSN